MAPKPAGTLLDTKYLRDPEMSRAEIFCKALLVHHKCIAHDISMGLFWIKILFSP